jgi:hypothetical protein
VVEGIVAEMRPHLRRHEYGSALERAVVLIGLATSETSVKELAGYDATNWLPLLFVFATAAVVLWQTYIAAPRLAAQRQHVIEKLRGMQADLEVRAK